MHNFGTIIYLNNKCLQLLILRKILRQRSRTQCTNVVNLKHKEQTNKQTEEKTQKQMLKNFSKKKLLRNFVISLRQIVKILSF